MNNHLPVTSSLYDSYKLGCDMCAKGTEHLEVDKEHALGSAFGLEEDAFLAVKDAAHDEHSVSFLQLYLVGTEIVDVGLHLCGCIYEAFHLLFWDMEYLVGFAILGVAVGDEAVEFFYGIDDGEGRIDKDGVGNEGTLCDDFLAVQGGVALHCGEEEAEACFGHDVYGKLLFAAHLHHKPLGNVVGVFVFRGQFGWSVCWHYWGEC